MISVGGGKEGCLSKFLAKLVGGQYGIGQVRNICSDLLCNITGHGVGAAQYLKCIQAEAIRFIFYINFLYPKIFRHLIKLCQRRPRVLREALVKGFGTLNLR